MDDRPDWFEALADRYRVEREIGRGGMARVYRAEDLRFHRKVAIKVLREELALALAEDRFVEEVRLAARLNHPNIVPLYDAGVIPAAGGRPALPWFAMMYIEGETLRERLARGPLPVSDAVDLARAVAAALDYAHGEKVVHRDIKPANILLAGDVPVVADFGIARALDRAAGVDTLTAPGLAVGTAQYISPEQAGSESTLDHRTDVYSLGCVVYEMLAGHPPFTGPTAQAIIARHNLDPPPPLGTVRPTVPHGTVAAVEKALAKRPEDRWPSAGAFAHALRETSEHPASTAPVPAWRRGYRTPRRRMTLGVGGALIIAVVTGLLWLALGPRSGRIAPDLYAILSTPPAEEAGVALALIETAIERWKAARVRIEVTPGPSGPAGARPDVRGALRKANRARAGRLVIPEFTRAGDSMVLRLALWDTETGAPLGVVEGGVAPPGARVTSGRVDALVDSLVLGQFGRPRACSLPTRPAALPAIRKLVVGDSLMAEWALGEAADTFTTATALDPDLGPAHLCRALLMSWTETDHLVWGGQVAALSEAGRPLRDRDQRILAALLARQNGDMAGACASWRELTRRSPGDVVLLYGLADCLARDPGVVRDRRSRSGWRFRAEYGEARAAYARAVAISPEAYRALLPGGGVAARLLFNIAPSAFRPGRAVPPDTGKFSAPRTLEGDTLAYVPLRTLSFATGDPALAPPAGSVEAANALMHEMLYRLIVAFRTVRPREAAAPALLAEALEMRGDRSALDTLRLARALPADPAYAYHLAAEEVFLRIRMAAPADTASLLEARRIADSLLAHGDAGTAVAFDRAALAALRGRASAAVEGWQNPDLTRRLQVPLYLKGIAPSLQVRAAMGGPVAAIRDLEGQVDAAIRRNFANADQLGERLRWLALPASIAWPQYQFATLPPLRGRGDLVADAVLAAGGRDSAGVRRALRNYWEDRAARGRQVVTLDGLRTEAELRWEAGERDRAIQLLDESLGALFGLGPRGLGDPLQAAGFVRAAALRAEYAVALGQRDVARQWADVVRILWADAEPASLAVIQPALQSLARAVR